MGLRARLNLLLVAVFLAALTVAVVLLLNNARQAVREELRASTALAAALIAASRSDEAAQAFIARLNRAQADAPLRHLEVVVGGAMAPQLPPRRVPENVPGWFYALVEPAPAVLAHDVSVAGANLRIVANPADEIAEAWREVRVTLGLIGVWFVLVLGAVSLTLGRVLRPLTSLSAALGEVEQGDYAVRLGATGIPDIDVINDRFNTMSAALAASERDKAALAQRSLAIQEEERRHLARELHDDMGQSITAIKALAVSIRERADRVIGERAETIIEVSSSIYERVRQLMTQLHPAVLDELGLDAALGQMVDDWNSHHGDCLCDLRLTLGAYTPDDAQRIGLFRIAQEGLTNIARHAEATSASVELVADETCLQLTIRDNGRGFEAGEHNAGLGLLGIRERVRALGGTFHLDSGYGAGVCIIVRIPHQVGPARAAA